MTLLEGRRSRSVIKKPLQYGDYDAVTLMTLKYSLILKGVCSLLKSCTESTSASPTCSHVKASLNSENDCLFGRIDSCHGGSQRGFPDPAGQQEKSDSSSGSGVLGTRSSTPYGLEFSPQTSQIGAYTPPRCL
jgi:hypothetical protein